MSVKLLIELHLECLSLKEGCKGSSESTLVKILHCWKSHVMAQIRKINFCLHTLSYLEDCVMFILSYDVATGSEITPCNKIYKPLVVNQFSGNVMTSITTLYIMTKL